MSIMEELTTAYKKGFDEYWAYTDEMRAFSKAFVEGLRKYLGANEKQVITVREDEDGDFVPAADGHGNVGDDGLFPMPIGFEIPLGKNMGPSYKQHVYITIKRVEGKTILVFGRKGGKKFVIPNDTNEDVYKHMADFFKGHFENTLARLLKGEKGVRPIGFHARQGG
jgi:hypothetical protein